MKDIKKEDLELLYDMEKNNYKMEVTIQELDERISKLGIPLHIEKPNLLKYSKSLKIKDFTSVFSIIGPIICFIITLTTGVGTLSSMGFLEQVVVIIFAAIFSVVIGIPVGALVGTIICFIANSLKTSYNNKKLEQAYKREYILYENKVKKDKLRLSNEEKEIQVLEYNIERLRRKQSVSFEKLNSFYNTVGIDENYRNLIPIGYMYDFIRLGISTKLEGADGLYYLIRKELRYDQIQASLNKIITLLEKIVDQNSMIYHELKEINDSCKIIAENTCQIAKNTSNILKNSESIKSELEKHNELLNNIEKNSEINNYLAERTRKEIYYQNYLENKLNDRVTVIE